MDIDPSIELDVLALFAVLEGCRCDPPANLTRLGSEYSPFSTDLLFQRAVTLLACR
jgi:hypothetical protein